MMKLRHLLPARIPLAAALVATPFAAMAQVASPEQATQEAEQLFSNGQYKEAAQAFEKILNDYPTSAVVSTAQFRLGYALYILGEYDKAIASLRKAQAPPASPELQEVATAIVAQALSAKAASLDGAKRTPAFNEAIKAFDTYLQKYPNGDQVETITYGKALALFQIDSLDDAIAALRGNLQKFAKSDSVQDSQYLLALMLATQGGKTLQQDAASSKGAALFDEAEKLLSDIITQRKDFALMNDAQFQIGELLYNQAAFAPPEKKADLFGRALAAYRAVQGKDLMIKAQQSRIEQVAQRRKASRDITAIRKLQRFEENEQTKLEALKAKGDLTVASKIKVGLIFFQQQAYDEARVALRHMTSFADDKEQQKTILYYTTLTYSSQSQRDKAVEAYNVFKGAFKGDEMGDNLPLVIGSLFLGGTPEPEKAIEYFKEGSATYPNGRFVAETINAEATALLQLRRFDEAGKAYKQFLATKPKPELAVQAEFGLATIDVENKNVDAALAAFRKIISTYPETIQAEQSAFWVGNLLLQKGDSKGAATEFTNFIAKYPQSTLLPNAKFLLAGTYAATDKPQAIKLYEEVATEFPQSDAAPYTYFQRASLLAADQKVDEMITLLKGFIAKYSDNDKIFFAYDTIGQNLIAQSNIAEAISMYSEMVEKHPADANAAAALLNVIRLERQVTESLPNYLALNEEQRAEWNKGIANVISNTEKLLSNYPESTQVAAALEEFLGVNRLLLSAKLKTDEEITRAFQDLAEKFDSQPAAKSKILFTLANYTYEKDKAKALELMTSAYNPQLVYAPADIDLYGTSLIEAGKFDDAGALYKKLAADYPNPAGVAPEQAPPQVQEAQSIALYGEGSILQNQNKVGEAAAFFDKLKQLYPWSPKLLEANYGIAAGMVQENKLDEAAQLLGTIIRAQTATQELSAKSTYLFANVLEKKGDIASAIDNYIKVAFFYPKANVSASEGLWRGGQLLEEQAKTLPEKADPKTPKAPTRSGQLRKAIKAYNDLVNGYPNSPHVNAAKERLSALEGK